MSGKLITIATFSQAIEAHVSKTKLESEGIECFIADENIVNMNWFYSNAVGGVKLQVKEADVKRAIEILHQKPISVDFVTDEAEKEDEGLYCPKCNSSDVYYEKFSRRLVFTSWLILGIPFLFFKKKWICQKCGYEWKVQ